MSRSRLLLLCLAATACASRSSTSTPATTAAPRPPVAELGIAWGAPAPGTLHTLMPSPKTVVVGAYDPAATPVLRIASGDEVEIGTVSTCGSQLLRPGQDSGTVEPSIRAITAAVRDSGLRRGPGGHTLTGPIYVEGADSGDVLEVRIKRIDIDIPLACNSLAGFLREDFRGVSRGTKFIPLDRKTMLGTFAEGIEIPLRPFFGSIGVAPPPKFGRIHSSPPGIHAGNLDNKELVAGTILYIPVHTRGALVEVGDGHAAQGDGEVDMTALETALRGRLQFIVRKDMKTDWPRGETRTHWIAMGADSNLTMATRIAIREAIDLLVDVKKMTRDDAYMLISVGCEVRVTQLVDGTMGMHVMIPKSLFTR